ncbi:MAG: hypothetical protein WC156_05110 [Pedobacter sp.]
MSLIHNSTQPRSSFQDTPTANSGATRKRRWLFIIALSFIIPLVSIALLAGLALEKDPLVVRTSVPTVESAQQVKYLAKTILSALEDQREITVIAASESDLNAVMLMGGRGVRRFSGQAFVTPGVLRVNISLRMPRNPFGQYLNLRGEILPDERGLNIDGVKIGKLPLSGWLLWSASKNLLNVIMGNNDGSVMLESISSLDITRDTVVVKIASLAKNKERLKRLQHLMSKLAQVGQNGKKQWDTAVITQYYTRLLETERRFQPPANPSLADFLGPLFQLARERSAAGDPVMENSSALMALSIYLGNPLFDTLAHINLPKELLSRSAHLQKVSLGGRQDLRLHFIVSAGLKLLSDNSISSTIGEFKELLDANREGSGFSFVDLAAGRAGIRFVQVATDSSEGARRLQKLLAGHTEESLFFPIVADFPEDMLKVEFEQRYKGLDSAAYQSLVHEIDRRIDQCPVYQGR